MKWMKMKTYLAPSFIREIDHVTELYINLIKEIHEDNNYELNMKYSELRESIIERIDEIDQFYEMNFDQPYINHFEKGRIKLKKLLMYEPDIFNQFENDNDQEEGEISYNNEEEIMRKNYNGHNNMITEAQKQKTNIKSQLKKPISTTNSNINQKESVKTDSNAKNNQSKGLRSKKNINSKCEDSQLATANINQDSKNKTQNDTQINQIDNREITLQQYTNSNKSFNENEFNDDDTNNDQQYSNKKTKPQQTSLRMASYTDHSHNNNEKMAYMNNNELECEEGYREGDVINSNNDLVINTKSDNNSRIKSKDKQNEKSANKKDANNETKKSQRNNNEHERNQDDLSIAKASSNRKTSNNIPKTSNQLNRGKKDCAEEEQIIAKEPLKSSESETRELMIKFQLTENEYCSLVEAKSKLIMKYLAKASTQKH